jgi:hypothetical protein
MMATSNARKGAAQAAPTLDELAAQLREESKAAAEADLERALRLGELLVKAKPKVARGGWGGWLKLNFAGHPTTARDYMRLAEKDKRVRALACSSVREALAAIREPSKSSPSKKPRREAGKRLRKMREVDESRLRNARINIMKMVGILEGIDLPDLDLRGADPDTIREIHEELSILAEWLDRSLDAVGAEMNDLQKQETIRKLREGMNGRTDAEVVTMRRLVEKLEHKRQAIR